MWTHVRYRVRFSLFVCFAAASLWRTTVVIMCFITLLLLLQAASALLYVCVYVCAANEQGDARWMPSFSSLRLSLSLSSASTHVHHLFFLFVFNLLLTRNSSLILLLLFFLFFLHFSWKLNKYRNEGLYCSHFFSPPPLLHSNLISHFCFRLTVENQAGCLSPSASISRQRVSFVLLRLIRIFFFVFVLFVCLFVCLFCFVFFDLNIVVVETSLSYR